MAKPKKKYDEFQDIDTALLKNHKEKLKEIKDIRNKNIISFNLSVVIMCIIIVFFLITTYGKKFKNLLKKTTNDLKDFYK